MADGNRASATPSVETALESLQPIRDLAKNWDIDIAACLEEYLQDLLGDLTDEERRNLPKQAETLNFSQAALVLQNSSNVYSRKVEYLYKLVLQVHDELIATSGKRSSVPEKGNNRRSAADAEIDAFVEFDNHNVDFLLLDDVLPTDEKGSKINLKGKEENRINRDSVGSFATAGNATRLSLGATLVGGASRLDHSGVSAASAVTQHLVSGSLDCGSLRLIDGKCDVGDDGILIIPGAGGTAKGKIPLGSLFGDFSPRQSDACEGQQQARTSNGPIDFTAGDDNGGDYDHSDSGFDFADNGGFGDPVPTKNDNDNPNAKASKTKQETQSTPKRGSVIGPHGKSNKKGRKENPWALLDPHSQEGSNSKSYPLRIGKTYELPPAITEPPSQCVTGARTKCNLKNAKVVPLSQHQCRQKCDSIALAAFKAKLSQQRGSSKPQNKDLCFGLPIFSLPFKSLAFGDEFLYIAQNTSKQKAAMKREMWKETASQERTSQKRHHHVEEDEEGGYGATDLSGGIDDGDEFGFFGSDDYELNNGDENTRFSNMEDCMFVCTEDGHDKVGKTFEELCRAHIQAFAKGAEAYAHETCLSKRVGSWHHKLSPVLEEEENRPEFDIHAYTKKVVKAIQETANTYLDDGNLIVGFEVVTQSCPRYEVCRLFLASLSLSNSGNVRLHKDDFRIELLNKVVEQAFETYLAPSVSAEKSS